jgi:lysozyme
MHPDTLAQIKAELILDEGVRVRPYDDATSKPPLLAQWFGAQLVPSFRKGMPGKLTAGVGRNLSDRDLSPAVIDLMLTEDIQEALEVLYRLFEHFDRFSPNRQAAMVNMAFNLGGGRFLTFRLMIRAIRTGDWAKAAAEALDSHWAKQVQPERVRRVVEQLRDG